MPKTRMNDSIRNRLRELVNEVVLCAAEQDEAERTTRDLLFQVITAVKKKYPPRDMKILQKYDRTNPVGILKLKLKAGGISQVNLSDVKDPPLRPNQTNVILPFDRDEQTNAYVAWEKANDKLRKALKEKRDRYYTLIRSTRYYEDVVEIWPEAAIISNQIVRNLPVALSQDDLSWITRDSKRRMKETSTVKGQAPAS